MAAPKANLLGMISGKANRARMDAAIDAQSAGNPPPTTAAAAPARKSPPKKLPGRPAKAKNGLRDFFGL